MKIKVGDYEVLFSGTVISINDMPIIFEFPPDRSSLKFIISFVLDNSQKGPHVKTKNLGNKTLEILFVNFANSLGTGNTELSQVGFLGNRTVNFNYRVYAIDGISNTLHYTFYLGKEGSHVSK